MLVAVEDREHAYIFHVRRRDGTATFLHPFKSRDSLMQALENSALHGRYGGEPELHTVAVLREELYRLADSGVREWVGDVRFIPRFLLAAGTFVCLYLLLSLAVKRPLPLLDEFGIAFAAAVIIYAIMVRRDLHSPFADQKRLSLHEKIDRIRFEDSEFVTRVEQDLATMEEYDELELLDAVLEGRDVPGNSAVEIEGDSEEAEQLWDYLSGLFSNRSLQRQEDRLLRAEWKIIDPDQAARERAAVVKRILSRRVDVPLYALYFHLKREAIGMH